MKNWVFILLASLPFLKAQSQQRNDPGNPNYRNSADGFPIVSKLHGLTPILIDSNDSWLVGKAAALLQADIERVSGYRVPILTSLPRENIPYLIVIGSLDQSPTMQSLARTNRIPASQIKGKWESYSIRTISTPWSNVEKALIITGSDRRGTAYGVFDLSRQIGVSPWYWWADVPVPKINPLYVPFQARVVGSPAVKYRGFFINDEAPALSGWTREKFGGFNHIFYEKVFELLLRLKGNYLWPAMWGSAFNDDDPDNPILASKYGIVMGTSHHEPMLRAQQEWKRYGSGPWNYETNAKVLDSFWEKGIEHMDHHESIVTVGMRGDGDKPMTEGSNIALLEKIVNDQRAIIQKVTGQPPSATPQSWALYKEVQDYYDKGMRVPDDVTLLLCDDNWGNVRKLPLHGEKPRGGGYGMYYHFDYVGGPRNYKWINTNPIARTWEQMHLTKEYGDDRIWIVNVGDIKPMEFPLQFFLDYAWDPSQLPAGRLPEYTRRWAAEQFGSKFAAPIAGILTKYTKYNGRRKPELLSPDTYSLLNYREATTVVAEYNGLAQQADSIYRQLPEDYKDAYYQLVLYPVQASANLNDLYVTVANNRLYAAQGRAAANGLAEKARALFDKDSVLSHYYNKVMSYGKWDHMMDQTHIGYTYWQEPRHNNMPEVKTVDLPPASGGAMSSPIGSAASTITPTGSAWGVAVEGSSSWWPGGQDTATAVLPVFDANDHKDHFIEIFNRTQKPFSYTVTPGTSWLQVNHGNGSVDQQDTLWVAIDWLHAPAGKQTTTLVITGPDGRQVSVKVRVNNPTAIPNQFQGFVEANDYVSIEAQHFSKAVATQGITWQVIPDLGRTLSGVEAAPVTAAAQTPGGNGPHLEYPLYLFDTGVFHIQVYLSPLLEFNRKKIHYGISFDDNPPQIIDCSTGNEDKGTWDKMVADNIRIATSTHRLTFAGRHLLKFWMVDPGVVLQKIVVDAGGVKPSYLGPPESPHFRLNRQNH